MSKLIAENRRARFDYFLDERLEAGLALTGTEVKALREGRANIAESYVGVAGRDLARASLMRLMCGEDFVMLSGDDPTALGYVAHGGHGVISVTSNVAPKACAERIEAALNGAFDQALRWQDKLIRLDKALFADASPAPTKFALAHLGLCEPDARLPIAPCAESVKPLVLDAMRAAELV